MNVKKMAAIVLIWVVVAAGWTVLAETIRDRTGKFDEKLKGEVAKQWSAPQAQAEPQVLADGPKAGADSAQTGAVVTKSEVEVDIKSESRKRGLLWFPVYHVSFKGKYTVTNEGDRKRDFLVRLALPQSAAEFSNQEVTVDGRALPEWTTEVRTPELDRGQSCVVGFGYASAGTDQWRYVLPPNEMTRDLTLTMKLNTPDYDFAAEDPDCSPPDERQMTPGADGKYTLVWHKQRVSNARDIVVKVPRPRQPGQLTERICRFAPVCLFFFFVIMVILQVMRRLSLHPMHYLFLSAAFFAFHLLMAYLVDHVDLHVSFWISAAVSVFLVVMYLWLVAGPRAAILYAGLAQLVYLVLFSYSFFLEGFTGLTVTVGSIITLGVLMVMTAKVQWGRTMPELEPRCEPVPLRPVAAAEVVSPPSGGPSFVGEQNGRPRPPASG